MGSERHRAAGGRGARRLAAALLLAVAGGALVMVDVILNGMPLVPDPAGYALVAVAGVLLTAEPVTGVAGGRFQHVGATMAVLAVLATVDWVAIGAEWRPPPDAVAGRWALLDAAFLAAAVAVTVWLLVHVSRWCASQGLLRVHRRVRRSIHLVG